MTAILKSLIDQPDVVAITFRQTLAPVEGPGTPIFPATYPAPERGQHRFDTPYTVNQDKDGRFIVDIDSVQSQGNRMEAAFSGSLREVVPQHTVKAGDYEVPLTELPHRVADAAARATDLRDAIHEAMLAYAKGDPAPLAKLSPTSLVYGAWDSRDTHVKIPRAVRSEIRAYDCSVFTRSAQFTGTFDKDDLGLTDAEWKKGADVGFAPTPSVNAHGGVLVHGQIVHTASILLRALRRYREVDDGLLATYLLGLSLGGLLNAVGDRDLRSGCWLVADSPEQWETVTADGQRNPFDFSAGDLMAEIRDAAQAWSQSAGVDIGGTAVVHPYSAAAGKAMLKKGKEEA